MLTKEIKYSDPNLNLSQILMGEGYNGCIPTNTIVNKRRPGIGATVGEIEAPRHSIILEPFITVIETKKERFKDLVCVMYEKSTDDLLTYLYDTSIIYKKIITTPESLRRVLRALKKFDPSYRKNYFMLLDECEKLIQSANFRKRIFEPMQEFFLFTNKAMISATPIIPSHEQFEKEGFYILDMLPTFDYKVPIKIIATNNVRTSLRNTIELLNLKKDKRPVFLFTNCKRAILYFSKLEQVREDFKVFCAEDLDNKFFQVNHTPHVHYSVSDQSYAKYNAFTSRFFAAVDMFPKEQPHVIILTNLPFVGHSVVDPATDAVQIWGRARNKPASITHITNFYYEETSTKDQQERSIEKELYFIQRLQELKEKAPLRSAANTLLEFIDKQHIAETLEADGSVNPYLMDNYSLSKYLKSIYANRDSLLKAYTDSFFFIPQLTNVYHQFSDKDDLILERTQGRARRKAVAEQLHAMIEGFEAYYNAMGEYEYFMHLKRFKKEDEFIFNAYLELGFEIIDKLNYSKRKVTEEVFKLRQLNDNNNVLMIDKIQASFKLNIKNYVDDIKECLQAIYEEFGYGKSPGVIHTAKATDILKYFDGKLINGKERDNNRSYYRLSESTDKITSNLKYVLN